MGITLSVPSYVVPGSYTENLRWLEANTELRNVELLFFMYDDDTRAIVRRELGELRDFASRFSFTAHLPDEVAPEHEDLLATIGDMTTGYVVHPPKKDEDIAAFVKLMDNWRGRYGEKKFRLENTLLARFEPADHALAYSHYGPPRLCADLGHLVYEGKDAASWASARLDRIDELHLHGCVDGKDHRPFDGSEAWFAALKPLFERFDGILELELFSWEELRPGISALEPYRKRLSC